MSKFEPSYSAPQTASEPRSLLSGAAVVALREPTPVVKTTDAETLAGFIRHGAVDMPGAYVAYWRLGDRTPAYVGQSGISVAGRLRDQKFRHIHRPERIVTITDRDGRLTPTQTRVIERVMHLSVIEAGIPILGALPDGAVVSRAEYAMLRAFCAGAIRQMQVASLGFQKLVARDVLAGPVTEPGIVLDAVPDGSHFRLETRMAKAEMIQTASDFVLTPGSLIRDPGPDPRTRTIGVLRLELGYAGILEQVEGDLLRVLRPLRFSSVSAASRFVTGLEGGSPSQWTNVDDGGGSLPRSTLEIPSAPPVLKTLVVPTTPSETLEPLVSEDRTIRSPKGGFRHGR